MLNNLLVLSSFILCGILTIIKSIINEKGEAVKGMSQNKSPYYDFFLSAVFLSKQTGGAGH